MSDVQVVLTKGQTTDLGARGDISQGVLLEMYWNVRKEVEAASRDEFDVDYALYVCRGSNSDPKSALLHSSDDIVYWPDDHHVFPKGSRSAAITRSADERRGGNADRPDETGAIYFAKLPPDVVRIPLYVHIYSGSHRTFSLDGQRTQQLFKHANVTFKVISIADKTELAVINLGDKYPENWGILLAEFLKDTTGTWHLQNVEQPMDGDDIGVAIRGYELAAADAHIRI